MAAVDDLAPHVVRTPHVDDEPDGVAVAVAHAVGHQLGDEQPGTVERVLVQLRAQVVQGPPGVPGPVGVARDVQRADHERLHPEEYPRRIDGTRPPGASAHQHHAALRDDFTAALAGFDLRSARLVALRGAALGSTPAELYGEVLRPALHELVAGLPTQDRAARERALCGAVTATLVELGGMESADAPVPVRSRTAVVSVGAAPLDALDGHAICDVLESAGWTAIPLPCDLPAEDVMRTVRDAHAELAVLPTSSPVDVLHAAPVYQRLRALPDPPVIVACSLGTPDDLHRARGIGADDHAIDLRELLEAVDRHLPVGPRRWGVGIRRLGDRLVLRPTGHLDAESVKRLQAVASSRSGSFERLVVQLDEVADWTSDGTIDLSVWCEEESGAPFLDVTGALLDALRDSGLDSHALIRAPERASLRWGITS